MTSQPGTREESAPRKGQRITYKGREVGTVDHLDGNLCWVKYDNGTSNPFIWRFKEGLNTLHDWPTKNRHDCVHPIFQPILEGIAPSKGGQS